MNSTILKVRDLRVHYHTRQGVVKAVNGVSFDLAAGERIGLVGESGSGKSTTALALMRLIKPPGKIEGGQVLLDGTSILDQSEEEMRQTRLAEIAMTAQGAMNSLNPVARIRKLLEHAYRDHDIELTAAERTERIGKLLQSVGLRSSVADMYPHELSGGMKQRVCIAISICLRPKVLIADEPTTALDVVVQRQVMQTLETVRADLGASVILIGHDMGLMAQSVDRIGVMYAGDLVETGGVREMFSEPLHPYTRMLISSLPTLDEKRAAKAIPGLTPSLLDRPEGCPFHPRCPDASDGCRLKEPTLRRVGPNRAVMCHQCHKESIVEEAS